MIKNNVSLKNYSNFNIGGNASYFMEVSSIEDIKNGMIEWKNMSKDFVSQKNKVFVLGGGTNILFSDKGFDGLVIKNSITGIEKINDGIRVGAGESVSKVLEYCIDNSLSGLEWAGGLPGTIGGAVRGNAGAYNGETKDSIFNVQSLDLNTFEIKTRNVINCEFNYRMSVFKKEVGENEIITHIEFKLAAGNRDEIKKLVEDKKEARKKRHPLEYPNIGSIFKNVPVEKFTDEQMKTLSQFIKNDPFPVIATAKINFLAGLSGKKVGDAMLSEKHTNFIVNLGNAKASEVKTLIELIKDTVHQKFNIDLEEEIMFVDN